MTPFMPDQQPADDRASADLRTLAMCWRCGLPVAEDVAYCPHCAARLVTSTTGPFPLSAPLATASHDSFDLLFKSYIILLVTGIVHACVLGFTVSPKHRGGLDRSDRNAMFTQIAVVEAIDTAVIAWTVYATWGLMARLSPPQSARITAWLLAIPALGDLLALNLGYHALLRKIIHAPLISDEMMRQFDLIAFLTICVQPAVVEEAYCRLFALDCLRGPLGRHAAVWISATMFGFLHVAVLPSVPYLIVVGAVLAYLRLASGTLLLPILVHLVHNLVILLIECGMK
jgi:membrane protease YdiL (CAAX protease family)